MQDKQKRFISAGQVATAIEAAIPAIACDLPSDVLEALTVARAKETGARGAVVLDHLTENARIASEDQVPLCQDTGVVWACLEIGPGVTVEGDVFSGVDAAVARAYCGADLRKSLVRDAFSDRSNTGDNTPAFCELHLVPKEGLARLHIMLKGGGSDNASRVVMLDPSAGTRGVREEVLACVREKAANACAPLVIGIGIGATFDKVASLAKQALMRPLGKPSADSRLAAFEEELLDAVNATGIGPGGLGGDTTALGVHVLTAPCHIAALPLAINMGCSAMRRKSIDL
ncbi:MAG: fumarate hydratase [Coriobacteriaceae bacterium]|nr:fumarate hydratase [Coriobacteriaceae bacterium]